MISGVRLRSSPLPVRLGTLVTRRTPKGQASGRVPPTRIDGTPRLVLYHSLLTSSVAIAHLCIMPRRHCSYCRTLWVPLGLLPDCDPHPACGRGRTGINPLRCNCQSLRRVWPAFPPARCSIYVSCLPPLISSSLYIRLRIYRWFRLCASEGSYWSTIVLSTRTSAPQVL